MAWYPSHPDYQYHWIPAAATTLLALLMFVLGKKVTTKISFDILEHCDPKYIKDSSKNAWTNLGVTSALVLTMVMAMLQASSVQSKKQAFDHSNQLYGVEMH